MMKRSRQCRVCREKFHTFDRPKLAAILRTLPRIGGARVDDDESATDRGVAIWHGQARMTTNTKGAAAGRSVEGKRQDAAEYGTAAKTGAGKITVSKNQRSNPARFLCGGCVLRVSGDVVRRSSHCRPRRGVQRYRRQETTEIWSCRFEKFAIMMTGIIKIQTDTQRRGHCAVTRHHGPKVRGLLLWLAVTIIPDARDLRYRGWGHWIASDVVFAGHELLRLEQSGMLRRHDKSLNAVRVV